MGIILLSYLPALLGISLIALFVLARRRQPMYVAFALTFLAIVVWQLAQFICIFLPNDAALWTMQLSLAVSNFVNPALLLFALLFPEGRQRLSVWQIGLIFLPAVILMPLSFHPAMVTALEKEGYNIVLSTGLLYDVQTFLGIAYIVLSVGALALKYQKVNRREHAPILLMCLAFALPLVVGFLSNYVWIQVSGTQYLLPIAFLIMAILIAYAIIRHRLFDIRLVVARAVGYVLLLVTLLFLYAGLIFVAAQFVYGDAIGNFGNLQSIVYFTFAVLLAFTFNPLKVFFDRVTDSIFYRRDYSPTELLATIGDITANEINVKRLSMGVASSLYEALRPEYALVSLEEHRGMAERRFVSGIAPRGFTKTLLREVNAYPSKVLMTDYIDGSDDRLQRQLEAAGIGVIVRLETSRERIGYLILGTRRSGGSYNSKDDQFFKSIGNELALAVQNGLRFEEIQNFNETLQGKIEVATERLRKTNQKLRQLDATKDEFVSMASHQLRTPLTSVKGYLSMVLEGDAGKLNPAQEKLLKEAYTSSERMVRLISDFLNVSRLRTGKFVIERSMVNLANVIDGEINQLRATAATRDLTIRYDKPLDFPTLQLDKGKIQQVIMNFMDNAIFYSLPGGEIVVELMRRKDDIIFRVKDSGIGVPASEKKHLFTKFYRATNARQQRPDGTGIGLFMAQKIIVAHGGAIIFESIEGKGSTFGFRLPIATPDTGITSKRLG